MSASADDATPAPDADDEAQPGPAGTAAEGSTTMAQEEEAGQPSEEEEPTDILDRLRREDRVSLTPEQPMLGRRRRSSATPAAPPPPPPPDSGEESILDRLHREQSPTAAAAVEGESILDRLRREQSPVAAAAAPPPDGEESILDRLHREQSPTAAEGESILDRLRREQSPASRFQRERSPAKADKERCVGRKVTRGRHSWTWVEFQDERDRRLHRLRRDPSPPAPPSEAPKRSAAPAAADENTDAAGYQYVYVRAAAPAPAVPRGPRRVTCYMCGLQAGTKSIRFHHEKCAARWPATEARPLPPAVVVPAGGAALAAYNRQAAATYAAHSKRACPLCGKVVHQAPSASRTVADKLRDHLRNECPHRRGHKAKASKVSRAGGRARAERPPAEADLSRGGASRQPRAPNVRLRPPLDAPPPPPPRRRAGPSARAVARREAMRDPLVREGLRAAALADQRGDGARASAERRGARLVAASIANRVERRRTGNKQFAVAGGQYAY